MHENSDNVFDMIWGSVIDEDYEEWLDTLGIETEIDCWKCGAAITDFELDVNNGNCPCCGVPMNCEACTGMFCNDCPAPIEKPAEYIHSFGHTTRIS
jgi:hypothetical protein